MPSVTLATLAERQPIRDSDTGNRDPAAENTQINGVRALREFLLIWKTLRFGHSLVRMVGRLRNLKHAKPRG